MYGQVEEIYRTAENGWTGEDVGSLIGTEVSVRSVEDDGIVSGWLTERDFIKTEHRYKKEIRKDVKNAARYIGHAAARNAIFSEV